MGEDIAWSKGSLPPGLIVERLVWNSPGCSDGAYPSIAQDGIREIRCYLRLSGPTAPLERECWLAVVQQGDMLQINHLTVCVCRFTGIVGNAGCPVSPPPWPPWNDARPSRLTRTPIPPRSTGTATWLMAMGCSLENAGSQKTIVATQTETARVRRACIFIVAAPLASLNSFEIRFCGGNGYGVNVQPVAPSTTDGER